MVSRLLRAQRKVHGDQRQCLLLPRVVVVLQSGVQQAGRGVDGALRVLGQAVGAEARVRTAQGTHGMQRVLRAEGGALAAGGGAARSSKRMDGMCNKCCGGRKCGRAAISVCPWVLMDRRRFQSL